MTTMLLLLLLMMMMMMPGLMTCAAWHSYNVFFVEELVAPDVNDLGLLTSVVTPLLPSI